MNIPITMATHTENYLNERRRLGFGLRNPGYAVISFARYIDVLNSQEPLTVEIMVDWAGQDKGNSGKLSTWARRLKNLRSFCRYLQQFEPRTEVPQCGHSILIKRCYFQLRLRRMYDIQPITC